MLKATCPECGETYFGWVLMSEENARCKCGERLEIEEEVKGMKKKKIGAELNMPPTTDSILAAMRDAVQEKDALIEQIIKENLKLKELLRKGDNDEPSD